MKYILLAILAAVPFRCAHADMCLPTPANTFKKELPSGSSVGVVICDDADALKIWPMAGSISESLDCAVKVMGSLQWTRVGLTAAIQQCRTRDLTAEETWGASVLQWKYQPRLTVHGGPVYTKNLDGSLGPQWVNGGVSMTLPAGGICNRMRLASSPARYYNVQWLFTVNGFKVPTGDYFALCDFTPAPAAGFAWSGDTPTPAPVPTPPPGSLVTVTTVAYAAQIVNGKGVMAPLGTVPLGTVCGTYKLGAYNALPASSVTSSNKTATFFGECK